MRKPRQFIACLCAYTHLWKIIKEGRLPPSAKPGFSIALLGLLCPFFWVALLSGATKEELIFHACHSGLVFFMGVFLMLKGLAQQGKRKEGD